MKNKPMTYAKFQAKYPTDDVCLEHIFRTRYGTSHACEKCGKEAKFYRVKKRRCHECEHCGHQLFATAGTPFEKTKTPLTKWFLAMYLFTTSRNGVSAKELQRTLGVTYKCAWRMGHEIRKYMAFVDGDAPLGGDAPGSPVVEADKAFIGGRDKAGHDDKVVVLGIVERGGEVVTRIVDDRRETTVVPVIKEFVKPGSKVATDEARAFRNLAEEGYLHGTVNHAAKEYVRGPVHTNTIEAFWGNFKRGLSGTYVSVSRRHLQKYLCEFEYRHNLRKQPDLMLELLMRAFPSPKKVASRGT